MLVFSGKIDSAFLQEVFFQIRLLKSDRKLDIFFKFGAHAIWKLVFFEKKL